MMKIKKGYTSKSISIILTCVLLHGNIVYPAPCPQYTLRIPIGPNKIEKRFSEAIKIQKALQQLRSRYPEKESFTVKDIAKEIGTSDSSVYEVLQHSNISPYVYDKLGYMPKEFLQELKTLADAVEDFTEQKYGPKMKSVIFQIGRGIITLRSSDGGYGGSRGALTQSKEIPLPVTSEAFLVRGIIEFNISVKDNKDYSKETKEIVLYPPAENLKYSEAYRRLADFYSKTKSAPFSVLLDVFEIWGQHLRADIKSELLDVLKLSDAAPSLADMDRLLDIYKNNYELQGSMLPLLERVVIVHKAEGVTRIFDLAKNLELSQALPLLEVLMLLALEHPGWVGPDRFYEAFKTWHKNKLITVPAAKKLIDLIPKMSHGITPEKDLQMIKGLQICRYLLKTANDSGMDLSLNMEDAASYMNLISVGLVIMANDKQNSGVFEEMFPVALTLVIANATQGLAESNVARETISHLCRIVNAVWGHDAINDLANIVAEQPFVFSKDKSGNVSKDFDKHLKSRLKFLSLLPESVRRSLLIDLRVKLLLTGAPVKDSSFAQIELSRLIDQTTPKTFLEFLQLYSTIPLSSKIGPETKIDSLPKRMDVVGPKGEMTGIPGLLRQIRILAHSSTNLAQLQMLRPVIRYMVLGEDKGMLGFFESQLLETISEQEIEPLRNIINELILKTGIPKNHPERILDLDVNALKDFFNRDVSDFWNQSETTIAHTDEDRLLLLIGLHKAFEERYAHAGSVEERLAEYKFDMSIEKTTERFSIRNAKSKDTPFPSTELLLKYGQGEVVSFPQSDDLKSSKKKLIDDLHNLRKSNPLGVLSSLGKFREQLLSEILSSESYVIETFAYNRPHAGQVKGDPRWSTIGYYKEPKFEWLHLYRDLEELEDQLLGETMDLFIKTPDPLQKLEIGLELLNFTTASLEDRGIQSRSLRDFVYLLTEYPLTVNQASNLLKTINGIHKKIVSRLTAEHKLAINSTLEDLVFTEQLDPQYGAALTRETNKEESSILVQERTLNTILKREKLLRRFESLTVELMALSKRLETFPERKALSIIPEITMISSYDTQRLLPEQEAVQRGLYGAKAMGLLFLRQLDIPVPDGFVIPVNELRSTKDDATTFSNKVLKFLSALEGLTGKTFGDPTDPLLVSVRSGAVVSMPGIMETFSNLGLNDKIANSWADRLLDENQDPWFVYDSLRHNYETFGTIIFNIERKTFEKIMTRIKNEFKVEYKKDLPWDVMKRMAMGYKQLIEQEGHTFPDDPHKQLFMAIRNVEKSWWAERAQLYRKEQDISDEWGTSCIVQDFVFGNKSEKAGSGVIFTSNLKNGKQEIMGNINFKAQGEDVVSGVTTPEDISVLKQKQQSLYKELEGYARKAEEAAGYPQEIEFTIEEQKDGSFILYLLQTKDAPQYGTRDFPQLITKNKKPVGLGNGVYGGGFRGVVVEKVPESTNELNKLVRYIEKSKVDGVIIVREYTGPEAAPDLLARRDKIPNRGMLTKRGGGTSHMAVTARNNEITCVVGCSGLNYKNDRWFLEDKELIPGKTIISIDGNNGNIFYGRLEIERKVAIKGLKILSEIISKENKDVQSSASNNI